MGKEHNKSPAFQWYPKDFIADIEVQMMTPEQRGAYIMLLSYAWLQDEQGTLPNDDEILATLSGLNGRWADVGHVVKRMFNIDGERLVHKRLLKEKMKQIERREICSRAGKASANKRLRDKKHVQHKGNTRSTDVQHKGNTSSSFSSSSSNNIFDSFWKEYPKRNGRKQGKQTCQNWWNGTGEKYDKEQILAAAKNYAKSDEAKRGYARDPIRFLQAEYWKGWLGEKTGKEIPTITGDKAPWEDG